LNKELLKTIIFIVVTIGLLLIALFTPIGEYFTRDSIIKYIKPLIIQNKIKAVIIFIISMTILPMVWVPRLIMTAVAGVLFGIKEGFIYAMIGSTIAGVIGYYFAKEFTSKYFDEKTKGKSWIKYLDFTKSNAFLLILYSRICPITHYEVINYLCGTSNVKFSTYFWPTFLGIIPGTFVYVWMGDVILKHGWLSPETMNVMIILGIFLVLTSIGFYKVIYKKDNKSEIVGKTDEKKEDMIEISNI